MKVIDYFDDEIPNWSLSYLINGDASGITEEDKAEADEWIERKTARLLKKYPGAHITLIENPDAGEGAFTWSPAFGLAADCTHYVLAALVDNDHPTPAVALPWEDEDTNPDEQD